MSSFQVFTETIGLQGLPTLIRIESDSYADKPTAELAAFVEINLLPALKGYWSVEEGLGIPLIQKVMTRVQFREIFQNVHFADTLQKLPPRDGKQCDRA